jgi:tripartite-type tricarboxylate transporter receptor subunit TctC
MGMVAKAKPDGYTLLLTTPSVITNSIVFSNVGFDPAKDFEYIGQGIKQYFIMVTTNEFPAKTMGDVVAYAKGHPNEMTVANGAVGTTSYLSPVLVSKLSGAQFKIVNYKGNAPAIVDLLGGHINAMFADPISIGPTLSTGKVHAVGITSAKRLPGYPDIPAIAETLPGYYMDTNYGFAAPKGTPKDVIDTLNKALNEAVNDPKIKADFEKQNAEVTGNLTPAQYDAVMRADLTKYKAMLTEMNIHLD